MLTIRDGRFWRDDAAHLIVSGALHYGRIHPGQWADRLRRLRHMGANTVETYVPWNLHAPSPDIVNFSGFADLGRFLDTAADADLDAIVRPGPYICAEWEGGGFPGWLLRDPRMRLRRTNRPYQEAVTAWFDQLIPIIAQRQYPHGGRVVMVQVENEYGSFGNDADYLAWLRDALLARGITVPLVTSDGPSVQYLLGGTLDGALPTMNYGSRAAQHLTLFEAEYPGQPAMCMEFWNGWFDHWGEEHHTRDTAEAAAELADMLNRGSSVNIYMAHGGTNFGLWNGCNHDGVLQPTTTSYDYDAPIAENGRLTEKFHAYRDVIARHLPVPELPEDLDTEPEALPPAELEPLGRWIVTCDDLEEVSRHGVATVADLHIVEDLVPDPPTFEDTGLERGMMLLRSTVAFPGGTLPLQLYGLRDRAHVFVDGTLVGILGRDEGRPDSLNIAANRGDIRLDLLVESQGRINFGPLLGERKGLLRGAWLGTRFVMGWRAFPLPLDLIGEAMATLVGSGSADDDGLSLRRYRLNSSGGRDGFLDTRDGERGFVYLDDFLLGRFWSIGPQRTLYLPAPLLGAGDHTVTVIDTDATGTCLALAMGPLLG